MSQPEQEFGELLRRTREGDGTAAAELIRQYEPEIRRAIRLRMSDPRLRRVIDSMDVCQSVLANFFVRVSAGQYDLQRPEDLIALLVAVTGMGGESGPNRTYCYLPADAQFDQQSTLMPITEFYELFNDCAARSKLLLVDTCQTAAIESFDWPASEPPRGTAVIFACSPREASYEHDTLRHGVFSYHVLRALEGRADVNEDRRVTLDELFAFTRSGVQQFMKDQMPGAAQTPRLVQASEGTFAEFQLPGS